MTTAEALDRPKSGLLPNLIPILDASAEAAGKLRDQAIAAVRAKVAPGGAIDGEALEREQHIAHGLAWIATYVEALRQVAAYAHRMENEGRFGEIEALLCQIGAAEYAAQLFGGVMMSQNEMVRLGELGVSEKDQVAFLAAEVRALIQGTGPETRARAVKLIGDGLYYNALNRALSGHPTTVDADEGLLEVVDRITETVMARHR